MSYQKTEKEQVDKINKTFTKSFKKSALEGKKCELTNYEIKKVIGKGTFGKVKLGVHLKTGENVAIKILEKSKILDSGDRERITREIHILKIIRHPNIVQLYEIFEDEEKLYLIMEYMPNGELFDYIVKLRRIKENESARFFQQIIDGIEYIHKLKIVHRDLKPENLLLDERMNLKIVDFGLSNLYKNNERLNTACGSPCYAAPEMIKGEKYNALLVDIWSSGIILYALLCGYLPFDDNDTQILYQKIIRGEFSIPSFLSSKAIDILRRLLDTNPLTRISIEEIKTHPFFLQYNGYINVPKGLIIGFNQIPIDEMLLNMVIKHGFDKKIATQSILNNRHNKITTLYYLLLKKFIRNGHISNADISSICFVPKILSKEIPDIEKIVKQTEPKKKVEEVLSVHHRNIQSKVKKTHPKKMNNTTLMSYEENLRNSRSPNPLTHNKTKTPFCNNIKKRKKGNQTLIEKKDKHNKNIHYSVSKENKRKRSLIAIPFINSRNSNKIEKKNKKDKSSSKRIFNSLAMNSKKKNPLVPIRKHLPSLNEHTEKYIEEPMNKNTDEDLKNMTVHRGPLNLNAVTMKNPKKILADILNALQKINVEFVQISTFSIDLIWEENSIIVELNIVHNFKNMYIVKFHNKTKNVKKSFEFCEKLFNLIEL